MILQVCRKGWLIACMNSTLYPRKQWLLDPSMKNVEIEAHYVQSHERAQEGHYVEKSLMDWEAIYTTPEQREWLLKIVSSPSLIFYMSFTQTPAARLGDLLYRSSVAASAV